METKVYNEQDMRSHQAGTEKTLNQKISELRAEKARLQTELASAQSSLVSAQRSLDSAQSSLSSKQSRLSNTSSDGSKYSLSKEISSIKSKISSLNSQISLLKGKISSLQDQIKQIDETIAQLQSTISETRSIMENLIQTMQGIDRACEANMIANNEAIQDYIDKLKKISDSVGGAWGVNDNPLTGIDPFSLATGNYQTASKIANSPESTAAMMAAKAAINAAATAAVKSTYSTTIKIATTSSTNTSAQMAAKAAINAAEDKMKNNIEGVRTYNLPNNWNYFKKIVVPNTTVGGPLYYGTDGILSKELQAQIGDLCKQLNIDYYLAIGTIAHESRCQPDPKPASANGLMQILDETWDYYAVEGGAYYDMYKSQREWAVQNGADFDDKLNPLANVTVGICAYRQVINHLKDDKKGDMFAVVAKYGEGSNAPSTTEILFYRDTLAKQAGEKTWYEGELYELD